MSRLRDVHVDAVVENDGLTSIAVTEEGEHGRPIIARILRTSGSVEAEMRALLLAFEVSDKARWTDAQFCCDALGVVRIVQGKALCRPEYLHPIRDRAQEYLAAHPGWSVEWVKRTYNSSAHAFAGQILRAYKHGREAGRREVREELRQ